MSELQGARRRGSAVEDLVSAPNGAHSHAGVAGPDAAVAKAGARQVRCADLFAMVDREMADQEKVLRELATVEREHDQILRDRARGLRQHREMLREQSKALRARGAVLRVQGLMVRERARTRRQHGRKLIQLFAGRAY